MFYTEAPELVRTDGDFVMLSQFDCNDLGWWSLL